MKRKFIKFALPTTLGLLLSVITIIAFLNGCTKDSKHCTKAAYPLYCKSVDYCCTPGHAYYCDGQCYDSGCPSSTITRDYCTPE